MSKSDQVCVNTIRVLSAEQVQAANSGHPGAPMGTAPIAHALFNRVMRFNPKNPKWIARDRYVQSNGHSCALLYTMLHLTGYNLSMDDLKNFRQLDSMTPGHPESHLTPGVEVTTGPLGQGISNAVGLAMAEQHLAARFNRPGFELFNNFTYVICGDGCLQEGVSSEACSLGGHQQLGKLIVLWDDNNITIDGPTSLSFSEDVLKRYESYGWQVLSVSKGDSDVKAIEKAIEKAKKETKKPTIIKVTTTIGFGAAKQGTSKVHGSPLGSDDLAAVKTKFGFDPATSFHVPDEVRQAYADVPSRGAAAEEAWNALFAQYASKFPAEHAELSRMISGELPADWRKCLPTYKPEDAKAATRVLSGKCLDAVTKAVPELIGGSADLTPSNNSLPSHFTDFTPKSRDGRYIRFGVREHGMSAICNGLMAYGALRPYCATFLNFIGYAYGAMRLSSVSEFGVLYIMTHDSIGLGEDGPTHQPIESLAMTRATPNMLSFRPADGNEVSGCYAAALENRKRPSTFALSRQGLPHLTGTSIDGTVKGGYIIDDCEGTPDVILIGTGSELHLCVEAKKLLSGKNVRIVSMPCTELFEEQKQAYRDTVLPAGVPAVSVEALTTFGWDRYAKHHVGMTTFGASAPGGKLMAKFGFTAENVAKVAHKAMS